MQLEFNIGWNIFSEMGTRCELTKDDQEQICLYTHVDCIGDWLTGLVAGSILTR